VRSGRHDCLRRTAHPVSTQRSLNLDIAHHRRVWPTDGCSPHERASLARWDEENFGNYGLRPIGCRKRRMGCQKLPNIGFGVSRSGRISPAVTLRMPADALCAANGLWHVSGDLAPYTGAVAAALRSVSGRSATTTMSALRRPRPRAGATSRTPRPSPIAGQPGHNQAPRHAPHQCLTAGTEHGPPEPLTRRG
jgi:hypothetical protein